MVSITVGNSFSRVSGLDKTQMASLRKLLSYQPDPAAIYFSYSRYKNYTKYLIDSKGTFPAGLTLRVRNHLDNNKIPYKLVRVDLRMPLRVDLKTRDAWPSLYPDQIAATEAAVANTRGGIVMPTGTGKSIVMANLIKSLSVRTLVVVPTLELKRQLKATFESLFKDNKHIVVENVDSSQLETLTNFDCLIIDECHHAAAKTYQQLNKIAWKGISYRFFFTATYFRNNTNEHLLFEGICGPSIYRLTYADAIKRGYIVPVEAYYYDVPKLDTAAYTYSEAYKDLVVQHEGRNKLISGLLQRLNDQGLPTLCLVKEVAHGRLIERLTGIPFVCGEDEESRRHIQEFNSGKIKALIGTTGVLGEGVDTKPAEYVVIAGLGKAKSAFLQQVGRGVRKHPGKETCKVILFRDTTNKFTLRHYKEQAKIVREEFGTECFKLEDI